MIECPAIALANQKNYVSLHVCAVDKGEYVAQKYKKELGSASVGKSCVRFKNLKALNYENSFYMWGFCNLKLKDPNLSAIKKILVLPEKSPGLQGMGSR